MQLALAVSQEWAEAREEEGGWGRGGAAAANAGASKCPRKGDGRRIGGDVDIGDVDCPIPNCPICGNGDGSGVASNPYARPANADAVLAAAAAALDREDGETDIGGDDEEDDEMPVQETPKRSADEEGPTRLDLLQLNAHVNSFWYMVALVQLPCTFIGNIRKGAHNLKKHVPGAQKLAEEYGYSSTTFKRRLESGTRLAALCAASRLYSDKKSAKQDIIALCMPDDKWGVLIQRLRIPLEYIRQNSNFLASLNFCYRVPIEAEGVPEVIQSVPFHSLIETDEIMEQINTNFAKLPPRSRSWYEPVEQWELPTDPGELQLKDPNREAYIRIDGDILDGNALRLEDSEGKMLSDYFKLPPYLVNILNFIQDMRLLRTLTIWIMSNEIMGQGQFQSTLYRMNQKNIIERPQEFDILSNAYNEIFEYIRLL
ncbi:hypothetical protein K438DRAFT_1784045 [Mycena galopus ATCC 62051]|nr:hypothetical protein K438DRAFT_1784045 [Mycena galopus ATCC 62051]